MNNPPQFLLVFQKPNRHKWFASRDEAWKFCMKRPEFEPRLLVYNDIVIFAQHKDPEEKSVLFKNAIACGAELHCILWKDQDIEYRFALHECDARITYECQKQHPRLWLKGGIVLTSEASTNQLNVFALHKGLYVKSRHSSTVVWFDNGHFHTSLNADTDYVRTIFEGIDETCSRVLIVSGTVENQYFVNDQEEFQLNQFIQRCGFLTPVLYRVVWHWDKYHYCDVESAETAQILFNNMPATISRLFFIDGEIVDEAITVNKWRDNLIRYESQIQ